MNWTFQISDASTDSMTRVVVEKESITVGREDGQDVVIQNPSVSRAHVKLQVKAGEVLLDDFGSVNGTYLRVNDILLRCEEQMPIEVPAELMLGSEVTCLVDVEGLVEANGSGASASRPSGENVSLVLSIKRLAKKQAIMVLDLCGSTSMAYADEEAAFHVKRRLDKVARKVLLARGTQFYKNTGDGFVTAFADPEDALAASRELLHLLSERNETTKNAPIHVRIALHYGTTYMIDPETQDIHGRDVNTAFRIEGVSENSFDELIIELPAKDRILCSGSFASLLGEADKSRLDYCGAATLKGIPDPVKVYRVLV